MKRLILSALLALALFPTTALAGIYTTTEAPPELTTGVSPQEALPGESVSIVGLRFEDATEVRFGSQKASYEVVPPGNEIIAKVPTPNNSKELQAFGVDEVSRLGDRNETTTNVIVVSPAGESRVVPSDRFNWLIPPTIEPTERKVIPSEPNHATPANAANVNASSPDNSGAAELGRPAPPQRIVNIFCCFGHHMKRHHHRHRRRRE